jgi:hypothetical protein
MKKITAILVIFIFVGTALSAQIIPSAGFMALGDFSFGNGIRSPSTLQTKTYQLPNFNFGGGTFFDGTYFEVFAGVTYGVLYEVKKDSAIVTGAQQNTGGWRDAKLLGNALEFGFGVLGKYPIELRSITIFPMFGFNYNVFMLTFGLKKEPPEGSVKTFSQFGLQAGIGLDYDLSDRVYFRAEALFQLRFVGNSREKYGIETLGWYIPSSKGNYSTIPGMGPVLKAGFGFRFS